MACNQTDPPEYISDRGKRRLVNNVRWALTSYDIAADPSTHTSASHMNSMRDTVAAEAEALRKRCPELVREAGVAALLERVEMVLGERTAANSSNGGGSGAPSPFPVQAVSQPTARVPEGAAAVSSATQLATENVSVPPRACQSEHITTPVETVAGPSGHVVGQPLRETDTLGLLASVAGPSGQGDPTIPIGGGGDHVTQPNVTDGDETELNTHTETERTHADLSRKLFETEQKVLELEETLTTEQRRHARELADVTSRSRRR